MKSIPKWRVSTPNSPGRTPKSPNSTRSSTRRPTASSCIDAAGRIGSMNRSAEALFGVDAQRAHRPAVHRSARRGKPPGGARLSRRARRQRRRQRAQRRARGDRPGAAGRADPAVHDHGAASATRDKFCAVLRDITPLEERRGGAGRGAPRRRDAPTRQKSDFLAKISHEIRTPLNAIIGFSEVMMEERFGPIGNERYRDYLSDIHVSGGHLMSLINDLLDLSKIEAGKLDLTFEAVAVNDRHPGMRRADAAAGEPRAHHHPHLAVGRTCRNVVADQRSLRQILLNLLSNAIKFTTRRRPGDRIDARWRTTARWSCASATPASACREKDIETALKPFRQVATAHGDASRRHRPRPAADQGAGRGQPRELSPSTARPIRARWSRWPSRRRRCWPSDRFLTSEC